MKRQEINNIINNIYIGGVTLIIGEKSAVTTRASLMDELGLFSNSRVNQK